MNRNLNVIYSSPSEESYLKILLKSLDVLNDFNLNFESFDSTDAKFAFQKYKFISTDGERSISNRFLIFLDESMINIEENIELIKSFDQNNLIYILSSIPCFESFLIAHFEDNIVELQKKCAEKNLITPQLTAIMATRDEYIKNKCDECITYLKYNTSFENYARTPLLDFDNYIKSEHIKRAYEQSDITKLKDLIEYLKSI